MRWVVLLAGVAGISLACGGAVGGGASARAMEMAEYMSAEHDGVHCEAAGVGDTVVVGPVDVRVETVQQYTGREIPHRDERREVAANEGNVLAVHMTVENNTPVALIEGWSRRLWDGRGVQADYAHYNSEAYAAENGIDDWPRASDMLPGIPVTGVNSWTMPPGAEEGAVLVVWWEEERVDPQDPRGRRRDFWSACAVIDLGLGGEGA